MKRAAVVLAMALAVLPMQRFLDSLPSTARFRFDDRERFNWGYTPRPRKGVAIAELAPKQREMLHDFLRGNLSEIGYRKVAGIIDLESVLGRDPGLYYFSLFGDPAKTPSGWRFEGHHVSINATHSHRDHLTPLFLGANPPRVLIDEQAIGRALFTSLDAKQQSVALIATRAPSDIITGNDRTWRLAKFEGLPGSQMNAQQRELLLRLVRMYVGNAPAAIAAAEMKKIEVESLYFAWAGGARPGQPHYYRIHGPTILIEYDNTQNGANHIHTVWRTPEDFGGQDPLARHYTESHRTQPVR